jgi:hypothetical protein
MTSYTNLISQFNTILPLFNSSLLKEKNNENDESYDKAKFVPIVFYILCSIASFMLALHYFKNMSGIAKYLLIFMAVLFNIPFILFYSTTTFFTKDKIA